MTFWITLLSFKGCKVRLIMHKLDYKVVKRLTVPETVFRAGGGGAGNGGGGWPIAA